MKGIQLATVKPYTPKQLSVLYGVSDKTFRRWLKPFLEEIGKRNGHFFSPNQVRLIFEKLGTPSFSI